LVVFLAGAACAQQAGESSQGASTTRRVVVEAGDLRMVLETTEQGLRVLSLLDAATSQE
jgi:hypothetical protein